VSVVLGFQSPISAILAILAILRICRSPPTWVMNTGLKRQLAIVPMRIIRGIGGKFSVFNFGDLWRFWQFRRS
jgi:hypothetical protein